MSRLASPGYATDLHRQAQIRGRIVPPTSAAAYAQTALDQVRHDPRGRLALLHEMYRVPRDVDRGYLPYRRAASAFMEWQLRRGLLNSPTHTRPGSPWWRAQNETLLRDTAEARALAFGYAGQPSSPGAAAHLAFIERPTARTWYLAHNTSIAAGYLANAQLAAAEHRVERFFLNVVLLRVLFAHALVSAPRLALGWLAPLGRPAGDPRVGFTGIFLSLSRVLPDSYPLGDDVENYVAVEHGFGHALDIGIIQPRLGPLYRWSANVLQLPALNALLDGETPRYAWDTADDAMWRITPSRLALAARWIIKS